jgi:RNA polymerase sigma-70 factor (ECF subfamily)
MPDRSRMTSLSDVLGSDDGGLSLLYMRYAGPLRSYARRLLADEQEADDLVHEAFLRFIGMVREGLFDPARGTVQALVYRIVRNLCLDRLRQVRLTESLGTEEPVSRSEGLVARSRVRLAVRALASLPDKQRRALLMRVREGLSYQDIAQALNASLPQVKIWICRARQRVRSEVERAEDEA